MTVEELAEYGVNRMDDAEIRDLLLDQGMGVLGLPSEDVPYLLPMSFGFDGESRLYFTYVLGGSSRKDRLSSRNESARFLVYSADTMFVWESVLLTGTLVEVPEDEWDDIRDALAVAWQPDLFRRPAGSRASKSTGSRSMSGPESTRGAPSRIRTRYVRIGPVDDG